MVTATYYPYPGDRFKRGRAGPTSSSFYLPDDQHNRVHHRNKTQGKQGRDGADREGAGVGSGVGEGGGVPMVVAAGVVGVLDHVEAFGIGEQAVDEQVVEGVSGLVDGDLAQDREPAEGEVADEVEELMADAFVLAAEALAVDRAVPVEDDGVVERAALGQAEGAEAVHIFEEAEGAGVGDLGFEFFGAEAEFKLLVVEERVIVGDGAIDLGFEAGFDGGVASVDADLDGLSYHQVGAGGGKFDDAGGLDELDKGSGRAVEDGNLGSVNLDLGVVDAEAGQRGHEVFNSSDPGAVDAEGGGVEGALDVLADCRDADPGEFVGADEDDAVVGGRRIEADVDEFAAMDAYPAATD